MFLPNLKKKGNESINIDISPQISLVELEKKRFDAMELLGKTCKPLLHRQALPGDQVKISAKKSQYELVDKLETQLLPPIEPKTEDVALRKVNLQQILKVKESTISNEQSIEEMLFDPSSSSKQVTFDEQDTSVYQAQSHYTEAGCMFQNETSFLSSPKGINLNYVNPSTFTLESSQSQSKLNLEPLHYPKRMKLVQQKRKKRRQQLEPIQRRMISVTEESTVNMEDMMKLLNVHTTYDNTNV